MDFELNEKDKALSDRIAALSKETQTLDASGWIASLAQAGYLTAVAEAEQREQALGLLMARVELATREGWPVYAAEFQRLVAQLACDHGADSLPDSLLKDLQSGTRLAAIAFSEPDRSLSPETLASKADPVADGYSLSGEKEGVHLAADCDLMAVLAAGPDGPLVCLIEHSSEGVELGPEFPTFGYQALHTRSVKFSQVKVPASMCIGPFKGEAAALPIEALRKTEDRAALACALGILRRCLEQAAQEANRPRAAGKPPAGYQAVRFGLAEMLTLSQTSELLAQRAACKEAVCDREAGPLLLCAKVFASEAACRVSDQAMEISASVGYRQDHPIAQALAEARFGTMSGHDSNAARTAIAQATLASLKN